MQTNFYAINKAILIATLANLAFWVPLYWATLRYVPAAIAMCLLVTMGGLLAVIWREATLQH